MNVDYESAIIDLTLEEVELFRNNETFRRKVIELANDIADETDRTVLITDLDGEILDRVSL